MKKITNRMIASCARKAGVKSGKTWTRTQKKKVMACIAGKLRGNK